VVEDGRALFVAVDVDDGFERRRPVLAEILASDGVLGGAFATGGSTTERGKVVVTFAADARPSQAQAQEYVATVIDRARRDRRWGRESRTLRTSTFPHRGSGGQLRVLGRNRRPDRAAASPDVPLTLGGMLNDLSGVVPVTAGDIIGATIPVAAPMLSIPPRAGARLTRVTMRWVETPGRRRRERNGRKNRNLIHDELVQVARDVLRAYGTEAGIRMFQHLRDRKRAISPDFSERSATTGSTIHPLDWHKRGLGVWRWVQNNPTSFPTVPLDVLDVPTAAKRASVAIAELAYQNGVRQENFSCDYARIAAQMGVPKTTAFRFVREAERRGLLKIIDGGRKRSKGQRGRCSLFMLASATNELGTALGIPIAPSAPR
jgi:hypothetical protein